MKRIVWMGIIFIAMYTLGQAQINTQQVERNVQNSVAKQSFKTIFCIMTGFCVENQNGQLVIDEKQVEEHMQSVVEQQDLSMHELYTENYLKQAREKGELLGITRDGKDPHKLYLLGDFYLFEKAEGTAETGMLNFYTHPRADERILIRTGIDKSAEAQLKRLKDLFHGTGFKLQTYDSRNPSDGMVSFIKTLQNGTVDYIVFRVFQEPKGKIVVAKVSRILGRYNLRIMRGMFQALKQTEKEVLTEHFIEKECKLGADCY